MLWIILIIFSGICLGIYGIIGSLFAIIITHVFKKIKKEKKDIFEEKEEDEVLKITRLKISSVEDTLSLLNYRQIIRGSDINLKMQLLSLLSLNPVRENVLLIKEALYDENEMIRILAATSLQKMEDYYSSNISELEEKLKTVPESQQLEIYFELAKFYDEYIYSTLISEDIIEFYQKKMLDNFEKAYILSNKRIDISEKYIRACIRFNNLEKAKELINTHIKLYPDALSSKLWLCDLYLKQREFEKLYNLLKNLPVEKIKKIPKIYNAYKWWMNAYEK